MSSQSPENMPQGPQEAARRLEELAAKHGIDPTIPPEQMMGAFLDKLSNSANPIHGPELPLPQIEFVQVGQPPRTHPTLEAYTPPASTPASQN